MTPEELTAIGMLKGVTFAVASWDKRAAANLFAAVERPKSAECNCSPAYVTHQLHGLDIDQPKPVHNSTCPLVVTDWQPMISEKMAPQLWRILFRYRRQIKHPERVKYLRMAEKLMVPEYRTAAYRKEQEDRYKLEKLKREAAQKEVA